MDNLPENVRKAFELYILGNKKEAFACLIPGSEYHFYLSIIESFKTSKGIIDDKIKDMIQKFRRNWPGFECERLELQSYLYDFENSKTDEERNSVIAKIDKSFVHGFYDYAKPAEIKGINEKKSLSPGKSHNIKINNVFNQDEYFNLSSTLK